MAIDIRPAVPADIEGIQRVAEAAWHEAHTPIVGQSAVESFLERFYDTDSFRHYFEAEDSILAVATGSEQGVVGFVSARPDDESPATYQLGRLYVVPDRWREGIGRALLEHVEATVHDKRGQRMSLGVMAENDRAIAFYEAAGYERIGDFYDDRIETPGFTYVKEI